jgi:hypothetical protein
MDRRAGPQPLVDALEPQAGVELADRAQRFHRSHRLTGHARDLRVDLEPRNGVERDDRVLIDRDVVTLVLRDAHAHFDPGDVEHVENRPSRAGHVAGLELGQRHAREENAARGVAVFAHHDEARRPGGDSESRHVLPGTIRLRALTVEALLEHGHLRGAGLGPRLLVLFELRETAAALLERELALLPFVGRHQILVAADVELRAPDVEPRGHQIDPRLRGLHGGIGLEPDDFLLGLGELRQRLLERVLLVDRIELEDDVAGLDALARRHHRQNPQLAADRRRGHRHHARRAKVARRADVERERPADRTGGRRRIGSRRERRRRGNARGRQCAQDGDRRDPDHHAAAHRDPPSSCSVGSTSATTSPGATPACTATSSRPRRRTLMTVRSNDRPASL